MQQVGVKFFICLTEVYVTEDNINAFNKTLNKPSKADIAAMLDPHYALIVLLAELEEIIIFVEGNRRCEI